jgi:hypothetical protein
MASDETSPGRQSTVPCPHCGGIVHSPCRADRITFVAAFATGPSRLTWSMTATAGRFEESPLDRSSFQSVITPGQNHSGSFISCYRPQHARYGQRKANSPRASSASSHEGNLDHRALVEPGSVANRPIPDRSSPCLLTHSRLINSTALAFIPSQRIRSSSPFRPLFLGKPVTLYP